MGKRTRLCIIIVSTIEIGQYELKFFFSDRKMRALLGEQLRRIVL